MGYHKIEIKKGVYGEFSKIREEFEELQDSVGQGNKILIICELTDLVGAIEEFALKYGVTLNELKNFSDLTKSAFKDKKRI